MTQWDRIQRLWIGVGIMIVSVGLMGWIDTTPWWYLLAATWGIGMGVFLYYAAAWVRNHRRRNRESV